MTPSPPHTLFIADLHLHPGKPELLQRFETFMRQRAVAAEALYILGDLFEFWLGDDDDDEFSRRVRQALRNASEAGVKLYFIHGNRDFLVGKKFAAATGCELLPESVMVTLYGIPVLLMHGDTLCAADVEYLKWRLRFRNPIWQKVFLALPLALRRRVFRNVRAESQRRGQQKSREIMDVTPAAVDAALRGSGAWHLIHGHTHRPATHDWLLDGQPARRLVLADWRETGAAALRCDARGWEVEAI